MIREAEHCSLDSEFACDMVSMRRRLEVRVETYKRKVTSAADSVIVVDAMQALLACLHWDHRPCSCLILGDSLYSGFPGR